MKLEIAFLKDTKVLTFIYKLFITEKDKFGSLFWANLHIVSRRHYTYGILEVQLWKFKNKDEISASEKYISDSKYTFPHVKKSCPEKAGSG